MKRLINWIKVIASTVVLVIFTGASFWMLTQIFRDEPLSEKLNLDALPDNSLDVVAFGSSQMQYSFSPEMFKEISGLNAMVMGSGCQNFSVTVAAMETMFQTQSPKYVIVDVFTATQESMNACYTDAMVYRGSLLTDNEFRIDALKGIKDNNPDKYLEYVFDLSFNHNKWKDFDFNKEKEIIKDYFYGYVPQAFDGKYDYIPVMVYDDQVSEPSTLIKEYIDKMIHICQKNNAQLVLVKVPTDLKQEDQALVRGILDYGHNKGALVANYIDTAQDIGWFIGRDGDTYHNNVRGAYKVTKAIYSLIREDNAQLTTMLSDAKMTHDYRKSLMDISTSLVHNTDDIYQLMEQIDLLNLPCVMIYKGAKQNIMQDSEFNMLTNIGFDVEPLKNHHSTVQVVDGEGTLLLNEGVIDSIAIKDLSLTIQSDYLEYANKQFYFNNDNFILFIYNPEKTEGVINSVDTVGQRYFWTSACYDKPCEFING